MLFVSFSMSPELLVSFTRSLSPQTHSFQTAIHSNAAVYMIFADDIQLYSTADKHVHVPRSRH